MTFLTLDQTDKETWHNQQEDNENGNDKNKDKDEDIENDLVTRPSILCVTHQMSRKKTW